MEQNSGRLALEQYICATVTETLIKFFEKPYSAQAKVDIVVSGEEWPQSSSFQQHQKLFSSLLQNLIQLQKFHQLPSTKSTKNWYRVSECIKRLSKWGKPRGRRATLFQPRNTT